MKTQYDKQIQKERLKNIKRKKVSKEEIREQRKQDASNYPLEGNARAAQNAAYLGIAVSTFWAYVSRNQIKKPTKFGNRVSVWDVKYIRGLAKNGIPSKGEAV